MWSASESPRNPRSAGKQPRQYMHLTSVLLKIFPALRGWGIYTQTPNSGPEALISPLTLCVASFVLLSIWSGISAAYSMLPRLWTRSKALTLSLTSMGNTFQWHHECYVMHYNLWSHKAEAHKIFWIWSLSFFALAVNIHTFWLLLICVYHIGLSLSH